MNHHDQTKTFVADGRVTVLVDETNGITGIGDAPTPKDAEKLAALSGVLQLQAAGLVSLLHWNPADNSSMAK